MDLAPLQATLFGGGNVRIGDLRGARHLDLGQGAWVDHLPAWLEGHEEVFEVLYRTTAWQEHRRRMYERIVDVPRLVARLPEDGPGHPILLPMADALSARYRRPLRSISLACYRDGRDSVAWHGDRLGPRRANAVVAIVSVGAPRRFLLRPAGGGASRAFDPGWGDLLVMGGTCQQTWEHSVPKTAGADPRISIQFREVTEES